jgi:hypothetical protein
MKAILYLILFSAVATLFVACDSKVGSASGGGSDVAATVNGKAINNQEVEKAVKAQFGDEINKLSPLELAQARLQALQGLIQEEIMYQQAEKEKTLPSEDEINQAVNQAKQGSGLTADEFAKQMEKAGETEASLREKAKRSLAIRKLGDSIAAKIEPPKDSEVQDFYKGNPEFFLNKRGASFAAIVLDPRRPDANGKIRTNEEFVNKLREVGAKISAPGVDFTELCRQYNEDPQITANGCEWQSLTEDQMKQILGPEITTAIMEKVSRGQVIPRPFNIEGKTYILKLSDKQMTDENLTLDSPNVKARVIELLTNARKQLVSAAYQARVVDQARVENFLAKRVVDDPNSLSGARPVDPNATPTPAATATSPSPVANANAAKPQTNANATKR